MRCARRALPRPIADGLSWHAIGFENGVGFRIAQATLLTVLLLPCLAAAGQQPEDDRDREERATYSPITSSERAAWVGGEIASAGALSSAAFSSALAMRGRSPKEWPRTASGYGRRFADAQAAAAVSSSIEAGLGTLWGEDPRYARSARQEGWARVGHAVASVALARRRDGRRAVAWARFAGALSGSVIENAWLPPSAATRSRTSARVATNFAGQLAANLWIEFWPDLRRRLPLHSLRGDRRE